MRPGNAVVSRTIGCPSLIRGQSCNANVRLRTITLSTVFSSPSSCCTGAAWPPPPRFESTPFGPRPHSSSDYLPPCGAYDGLATFSSGHCPHRDGLANFRLGYPIPSHSHSHGLTTQTIVSTYTRRHRTNPSRLGLATANYLHHCTPRQSHLQLSSLFFPRTIRTYCTIRITCVQVHYVV